MRVGSLTFASGQASRNECDLQDGQHRDRSLSGVLCAEPVVPGAIRAPVPLLRPPLNESLQFKSHNVAELAARGRARWKIENETFNVLKSKGTTSSTISVTASATSPLSTSPAGISSRLAVRPERST
jgi:hypothetical protein